MAYRASGFRLSIGMTLVILFVLLTSATMLASFFSYRGALNKAVHEGELANIQSIGAIINNIVRLHTTRLTQVAQLLAREDRLVRQLQDGSEESRHAIATILDQADRLAKTEVLEVVDVRETVVYSADDFLRRGKRVEVWGVTEALSGRNMLVSFTDARGIYICAIVPVRAEETVVGAVIAGVRLSEEFIKGLGREVGADLVLLSRTGRNVGSDSTLTAAIDPKAVDEAFYQKIPIDRQDTAAHQTLVYLPLLIIDEAYVLHIKINNAYSYRLLEATTRQSAANALAILAGGVLLGLVFLHVALRPLRRLRIDAERTAVELTGEAIPILGRDEVAAVVKVMETLTSRLVQQNSELSVTNEKLKELDKMKSEVISSVSHELRTPLTSILGFSKLILRDCERIQEIESNPQVPGGSERLRRRVHENLAIIVTEAERLSSMINDLLDLAKIESGTVQWRDRLVDVAELANRAGGAVAGIFEKNPSVLFVQRVSTGLPLVKVDPDRLHQVLLNLLSNAVKFTRQGVVELTVAGVRQDLVRFCVKDSGRGISRQEVEMIFKPFYQAVDGSSLENKPQGTGLGLSICRGILEHYGSDLQVRSELGVGSEFSFDFPAAPLAGPAAPEE